jgi:hypothetical protein
MGPRPRKDLGYEVTTPPSMPPDDLKATQAAQGFAPPLPRKNICIFTPFGRTFTFKNAWIEVDNESTLKFGYTAMSDGQSKTMTVLKHNIIGHAVQDEWR